MIRQRVPEIPAGILLSRYGEVHHDVGGATWCGKPAPAGRVAPVSQLQALVYGLGLCALCYPDGRGNGRRVGGDRR